MTAPEPPPADPYRAGPRSPAGPPSNGVPPQAWPPGPGQPGGYGPPPGYGAPPPHGQQQDQVWSVLCHLSIFVAGLIFPLVIYLVFRDTSPAIRHHAAEALNFHLTVLIASIVSGLLLLVLIGIVLLPIVAVGSIVFGIIAAVAAGNGQPYRYPLSIRFVS